MRPEDLTSPCTLPCGLTLPDRLVMAPMVAQGSDIDGHVTDEDVTYLARRSRVAGTVVTGAANVTLAGRAFTQGLSIAHDSDVAGLARLARAIKAHGARAVVQLHHGGREAQVADIEMGRVLAPSTQRFGWLPYVPQGMTDREVVTTVLAFGAATSRAIEAGFDGVEIHGANHYLLQQFFSTFSNHRTDRWGGDLEGRMAFPLAVVDEVLGVAGTAGRPFAVGYRISPDEVHGDVVGYTHEDSAHLIDRVAAKGVDYVHVSLWAGYDSRPTEDSPSYARIARDAVDGRCPVVTVSDVLTPYDAVRALEHGDLVGIGRAALVEPEFAHKIRTGRTDEIETTVKGRWDDLDLPEGLRRWYTSPAMQAILPPLPGVDEYLDV